MAKEKTQGSKKIEVEFGKIIDTDSFKRELGRIRSTLNLPQKGLRQSEIISRELLKKYKEESLGLHGMFPVQSSELLHGLKNYVFYNQFPQTNLGDVCEIENSETELEHYSLNEDPDSMGTNPLVHNDNLIEKLERYPVTVRIHSGASQRDVVDFIKKNWSIINSYQKTVANSKSIKSLKNNKTKIAHKERNDFIYDHRHLSVKKISGLVREKFGEILDVGLISKIKSLEEKRKKV